MDAVAELDLGQVKVHEAFVQVLGMAQELKVLKVGQNTVAVDGSKVLANASQHGAVSQERAGQLMEQLVASEAAIAPAVGTVEGVLADRGFSSEEAVQEEESRPDRTDRGTKVYAAMEKSSHPRTVQDLENKPASCLSGAPIPRKPTKEVFPLAGRPQTIPTAPEHPKPLNRPLPP